MQLLINHQYHSLIPLPTFREQWNLSSDFRVALFEPKDWTGLGSIEGASRELAGVRQRVVQAVSDGLRPADLMAQVETLTSCFEKELEAANQHISLRQIEIEFAVAGFRDILQIVAYRLIQLAYSRPQFQIPEQLDFAKLYQGWVDDSIRISAKTHLYRQGEREFRVRVINNIYGRLGLEVEVAGERYYVLDTGLACPAASYMRHLTREVAERLARSLVFYE